MHFARLANTLLKDKKVHETTRLLRVTGIPTPTPNSSWTLTFTRIWTLTRNLDLKLDPDLDSDLDLGSLNLWRIRFAQSESEFGLDSVKPSIECANPNPSAAISCSYRDTGVPCSIVGRVL